MAECQRTTRGPLVVELAVGCAFAQWFTGDSLKKKKKCLYLFIPRSISPTLSTLKMLPVHNIRFYLAKFIFTLRVL